MSKTFKIVLILLVVASVASAVLAVFSYIGKEREYMKRIMLEDKLATMLKDKRQLEKEVKVAKEAQEEAEEKLAEIETAVKKLSLQIEEEKDKSKEAVLDLAAKKKELAALKEDLENEKKEKLAISKKLAELKFDYENVNREVLKLEKEKSRLEDKLSDLKESSVDLDTIVVSSSAKAAQSEQKPMEAPLLRGRVLVVNRDYSFVVTDLGKDDGVQKGMVFEIKDVMNFLGRAEVDKVYETMSSASMLPGADINNIKKGNLVIESR